MKKLFCLMLMFCMVVLIGCNDDNKLDYTVSTYIIYVESNTSAIGNYAFEIDTKYKAYALEHYDNVYLGYVIITGWKYHETHFKYDVKVNAKTYKYFQDDFYFAIQIYK